MFLHIRCGPEIINGGLLAPLVGILLYISGNFFNDFSDRDWDMTYRPERALPSGIFSPGTYLFAAFFFAAAGIGLAFWINYWCGLVALLLLACIVIYTYYHKCSIWSVIPLGLCRGLLPVLGICASFAEKGEHLQILARQDIWDMFLPSFALICYIIGLSLSARCESIGEETAKAKFFARALLIFSGLLATIGGWLFSPGAAGICYAVFLLFLGVCFTKFRRPVPVYVSALLAGIPFLDGIVLIPAGILAWNTELYYMAVFLMFSAPIAVLLARLLQRIAPAT